MEKTIIMTVQFSEINDPKSWETYFKSLLKYRYGQENVFDIPDQNEGDWGGRMGSGLSFCLSINLG